MRKVFALLARLKGLRGTRWTLFGHTAERALIVQYEQDIAALLAALSSERLALAAQIAAPSDGIRGFGHVKAGNMARVAAQRAELLARWRRPADATAAEPEAARALA